jgi:ankyrin repeat protein
MILSETKDKEDFLRECHKNIIRIYNTYLTDSEQKGLGVPTELTEVDEMLFANLPESINLSGLATNIKIKKLRLLVSLYNDVAQKVKDGENEIDLDIIFRNKKNENIPYFDANTLMRTHRSHFFRKGSFSFLSYFFKPKSEAFLKKYDFFDSPLTPLLHKAVEEQNQVEVLKLISETTINQKNNYGFGDTPLTLAARNGNFGITQILIDSGAKIDSDALNAAITNKKIGVLKLLLSKEVDVNHNDKHGFTPLIKALDCLCEELKTTPAVSVIEKEIQEINLEALVEITTEVLNHNINWNEHSEIDKNKLNESKKTIVRFLNKFPEHQLKEELKAVQKEITSGQEPYSQILK